MCGLVGMAGKLEYKDEQLMKRLLVFDYFRGPDSTGLGAIRSGDTYTPQISKVSSHPIDLFNMKSFDTALNGSMSCAFIGHNRAATVGKVNSTNAHPFHCGKIVGAHNGTLDKESWERLVEASGVETSVDSEAIFWAIDKIGIKKTIGLMEEGDTALKGAWALTWVNLEDKTINFLRNKHRPLWHAHSEDFTKLFWASEYEILRNALKSSKVEYDVHTTDEGYCFWQFSENTLYTIGIEDLKSAKKKPKFKVSKLKGRPPKPVQTLYTLPKQNNNGGGGNNIPFIQTGNSTTHSTGGSEEDTSVSSLDKTIAIDIVSTDLSPFSPYMSSDRFGQLSISGCSWCLEDIDWSEPGITVYEESETVLCQKCAPTRPTNRVFVSAVDFESFRKSEVIRKGRKISNG